MTQDAFNYIPPPLNPDFILRCIERMGEMINFFPKGDLATAQLAVLFDRMVDTDEHMDWLTTAAISTVPKWQGFAQFRGIYCSRFKPKDGFVIESEMPGFRAEDTLEIAEREYFESEAAATATKIEGWRRERKLLGANEQKAIEGVTQEIETRLQIAAGARRLELEAPPPDPRRRIAGPMGPTPIRSEEENKRLLVELELQLRHLQRNERVRESLSGG